MAIKSNAGEKEPTREIIKENLVWGEIVKNS